MDNIIKNIYHKYLEKWLKKHSKFLLVILIYILYQFDFLISLLYTIGINVAKLSAPLKMSILVINNLIYVFIMIFLFKDEIKKGLKDLKENFLSLSMLSLKCWIVGSLIMMISSIAIELLTKQSVSNNEALVRQSIKLAPLYMLFTCSIVAPILEEMTFRRALKGLIHNKWAFILTSGLGFGLLHVIGAGANSFLDFLYIIPYGSMGCAFAYLLSETDNISLPIIIHMLHNTILVLKQILGA